jgi:glyoxylase-like metal-dependent hydrolase (beta-lactamase superfamily II)
MPDNDPSWKMDRKEDPMSETEQAAAPPAPILRSEPVEIAEGVFVLSDGGVPLVPNVGIVVGDRNVLVVDTGMGLRNGAKVLGHARELAAGRRLLLTVTHFHPEHGYGAQVFEPEATIVYNRAQADELRAKGRAYVDMFKSWGDTIANELAGIEFIEPHVAYDAEADLDLGGRTVQLRTWGLAHTKGDQVVFLPEERILFTGDLVETRLFPIFPYFPPDDADVNGSCWIEVLERLEALEPAIVVPGHGEVSDGGLVRAAHEYMTFVRSETARLAGEGHDADAIVAALEPEIRSRYADWDAPEWIGFAIRCFFDDLGR